MSSLTFYGGAGGVTGSKHLLEVGKKRLLFDCGTFQGLPDMRERNRAVPFPPESIDYIVLSHAHLDHCGMLPLMVKRGFKGSIYCTPATRDITEHMLLDMAGIEAQDAEYRQRHKIGAPDDREPLFTREDIPAVMEYFVTVPYVRETGEWYAIDDQLRLKFYDAGHILGSAVSVVEVTEADAKKYVAYSGDLGPTGVPLLRDPEIPDDAISTLLLESTYGGRIHRPLGEAVDRLAEIVREAIEQKAKIIIPAFSLGRTQVVVYMLHKLTDEGTIPRFPIFVDSPLAREITQTYVDHAYTYDDETAEDFGGNAHQALAFRNLTYVESIEESKQLNAMKGPFAVIAGSGMMTAGRVVHHLRHSITNKRNVILITGYQAQGTLGRRLIEGASEVDLYGDMFSVRAKVEILNEFSAHADQVQLQDYTEQITDLKRVYLVHGEINQAEELQNKLGMAHPEWEIGIPREGETITL